MLVYKFRITLEDNDNFLREIEIRPGQTFEDFHNAIIESVNLTKGEMASFFICDIKWRRHQEITLVITEEDEDTHLKSNKPVVKLMSKTMLNDCINNPSEQLIYIYDIVKVHTFFIELFKIYDNKEQNASFPRCLKSVSDVAKITPLIPKPDQEVIDDGPLTEFEDEIDESMVADEDAELFGDIFEEPTTNENVE